MQPNPSPVWDSIPNPTRSPSAPSSLEGTTSSRRGRRRLINLFDAVAGRVTAKQTFRSPARELLNHSVYGPRSSGHYSSTDLRLAPEDVLFRQKKAPVRYAERDIYWASDNLPDGHLPDSDLLMAVHAYASHFYKAIASTLADPGSHSRALSDEQSMDETALLAFGILLEEASRDTLGKRGDLVFIEPADDAVASKNDHGRLPKRRKVAHDEYVEGKP